MNRRSWVLLSVALLGAIPCWAGTEDQEAGGPLERSADALLIGIPAVAFGLTWLLEHAPEGTPALGFNPLKLTGSPRYDLGIAMARTLTVTYGLKMAVDEQRPNGKEGSFPSAHTSVTFAGAEFIRSQYGWGWGAPAYAAASYVGWSRVQTRHHWWRDVAAGAAIGILSNHDIGLGWLKVQPIFLPLTDSPYRNQAPADSLSEGTPGLGLELRF